MVKLSHYIAAYISRVSVCPSVCLSQVTAVTTCGVYNAIALGQRVDQLGSNKALRL